jgi:hypothetical protein
MKIRTRFVWLGLLLLFAAHELAADQLTVLAPAGGTFTSGTNMEIRWTYQFMEWLPTTAGLKQMNIRIREYSQQQGGAVIGSYVDVATVDVTAEHYTWKVAAYVSHHDGFLLELSMKEHGSISAQSQPFQIALNTKPKISPDAFKHLIAVTSPAAGQSCKIGSTVTIAWDKSHVGGYGTVMLLICWPNHTAAGGPFPAPNTGSYQWKIAETAENTLCVEVYTQDKKYLGYSGNFKVVW